MAKKSAASKTTVKKTASKTKSVKSSKSTTGAKPSSKKQTTTKPKPAPATATTKKPAAKTTKKKKTTTKKTPVKKASPATAGASGKKTAAKAASAKTVTKKSTAKKTTKKPVVSKSTTSKPTGKKVASAAPNSKPASQPKTPKAENAKAPAQSKADAAKTAAQAQADANAGRKGITVVENRPRRKSPVKSKITPPAGTLGSLLAKRKRQPLIPSGPDAPPSRHGAFGQDEEDASAKKKPKSPFKKRELDGFREQLVSKRRELVGDVTNMESGMASRGDRGGNPALDVAEQGSDAYDQSLSIGLAEADRKIIREIDDAIRRIEDGAYGLCEVTHEPIGVERLKQLPWARLSIEAAREIERRGGSR